MTRQDRTAALFIAPVVLATFVVLVLPTIGAALLSVTDFDIYALGDPANLRVIGFDNYTQLLKMPLFWRAVANTVLFAVIGVPAKSVMMKEVITSGARVQPPGSASHAFKSTASTLVGASVNF